MDWNVQVIFKRNMYGQLPTGAEPGKKEFGVSWMVRHASENEAIAKAKDFAKLGFPHFPVASIQANAVAVSGGGRWS